MRSKFYIKLLALLGFGAGLSACADGPVMYGPGPAMYRSIAGQVTNQAGEPVKGIQVSSPGFETDNSDIVLTDIEGKYILNVDIYGHNSVLIEFDDIDGPENGGDFESASISVGKDVHTAPAIALKLKGENQPL